MSAAIYFHPEAYNTSGPKLMGRNAAGESFLKGFIKYSITKKFWAQVEKQEHGQSFFTTVRKYGRKEPVDLYGRDNQEKSEEPGVIFYPGPGLLDYAWQRTSFGHSNWSVCGITHTTSSKSSMDSIVGMLTAPLQPWDCLICTSSAVKSHVMSLLEHQAEYLMDRFNAKKITLPQIPIIPLGIHTSEFNFSETQKQEARNKINVKPRDVVILYFGRLSFHAKAHPLAMYQALEGAVKKTGRSIVLIECGWHHNQYIQQAFDKAGQVACPSVRRVFLDGRLEENRNIAWASADIFCSLSDNVQETFGITPVEAMAAGIPVVVSDWNGYKDTIENGVEGFRVPTIMPKQGMGEDLVLRYELGLDTYDAYCGNCCSLVSVDVEATTNAFIKLTESEELRKKMGMQGLVKAKRKYDWKTIIHQYEELWAELNAIRKSESPIVQGKNIWPARLDPFKGFASYPSKTLNLDDTVSLVDIDAKVARDRISRYIQLEMVKFATIIVPSQEELEDILENLSFCSKSVSELIENHPIHRKPIIYRSVVWLVKLNVIRIIR
ncbi:MAG: glycosyl transferase-like protein [Verrucomicrobiaceae bacterium]|nr:glycosyl transferase-like protein [Verrucomicrobiaceae bacterium]